MTEAICRSVFGTPATDTGSEAELVAAAAGSPISHRLCMNFFLPDPF